MSIKEELKNQIKIREAINKKWSGSVFTEKEIKEIKQKLKEIFGEERMK